MKREIIHKLMEWKDKSDRKPLILKGVRQCGKTYALKKFGKEAFQNVHYINFEDDRDIGDLFEENLDPKHIIETLNFRLDTAIDLRHDLVIFDEIQACPRALTSLKYFNEKLPELAVCSAGSLLGLQLNPESFPVGQVDLMDMRPLTFYEFLLAIAEKRALDAIENCQRDKQVSSIVHQHIWECFKWYLIVGGLPEVVNTFVKNKENLFVAFEKVREKQSVLTFAYYADIAKHSGKVNAMHIDRVWRSSASQLAKSVDGTSKKFKFSGIVPGIDRYQRLASAIDWLITAGLVIKTSIINHPEIPLNAYTQESSFKLYIFDVGILGAMNELPPKAILDYDYGTYKGYFAENFVAQEFTAQKSIYTMEQLYCWQQGRHEVEFLVIIDNKIIPIEVKAGNVVKAKSLATYCQKYQPPYRVIISGRNLLIDDANQIHQYPLYLASKFLSMSATHIKKNNILD